MLAGELSHAVNGLLSLGKDGREDLPDVGHIIPYFQGHINPGFLGLVGEANRVVEQYLSRAYLDKQGGQPVQVGIEGGTPGAFRGLSLQRRSGP